jgi:hypothetical protein
LREIKIVGLSLFCVPGNKEDVALQSVSLHLAVTFCYSLFSHQTFTECARNHGSCEYNLGPGLQEYTVQKGRQTYMCIHKQGHNSLP